MKETRTDASGASRKLRRQEQSSTESVDTSGAGFGSIDKPSRRAALRLGAMTLAGSFAPSISFASEPRSTRRMPSPFRKHQASEFEVEHYEADLGDVRIHYVMAGAGEPIVLLHGWPETCYQWRKVIPRLAKQFRVIAPDLRGLGDSSKPSSGYDKHSLGQDVYRLLHDVLGYERWSVAGYSWGAVVAYALAAAHPDAVGRLAVIGVAPLREGHEYRAWWHLFHQVPELPEALIRGREKLYFSWFYENFAHPSFVMPEEVIAEYLRTFREPETLRAALEYYRTIPLDMARNSTLARTFTLPMPVLAICNEGPTRGYPHKSLTNGVAESMRELAHEVSGVMFAATGYLIPEEKPELLAGVLETFFVGENPPSVVL